MASIPLVALDSRAAQEQQSPLAIYAQMQQLRNAQTQQQTAQLQQTALSQENQQRALQLQDSQTLRSLAPQHIQKDSDGNVTGFDTQGLIRDAASKGVNPNTLNQMQTQYLDTVQKKAQISKEQREEENASNDKAYQILEGVRSLTDPQQQQQNFLASIPKLQKLGIDTSKYPQQLPNDPAAQKQMFDSFESTLGVHKQVLADAETQAKTAKDASAVALENIKVNLSKNSKPGDFDKQIDAIAPPTGANAALNARTKANVNASLQRGDFESANKYIEAASSEIGAIEKETNPQVQANKVATAKAEGEARANIEAQTARGSQAALATVPVHLVAPATAAAEKANKEFADAKSVSDRMNATMDAARKGNVVSYQIIPEEGTLQITTSQGVHRINKTEIDQYAGGGSLWQQMQGHFGKALTGKSIPDSVLNDMAEIQKIQAEGAQSRYENTLGSINQTYGSKFEPVKMKGLNDLQQHTPGGKATGLKEGQTGKGSDGKPYVVKGGVWVAQ